jgi:hypothetical protein
VTLLISLALDQRLESARRPSTRKPHYPFSCRRSRMACPEQSLDASCAYLPFFPNQYPASLPLLVIHVLLLPREKKKAYCALPQIQLHGPFDLVHVVGLGRSCSIYPASPRRLTYRFNTMDAVCCRACRGILRQNHGGDVTMCSPSSSCN